MILEAMYNGEFYPCETVVPTSPEYRKAVQTCAALMEQLSQRLSKEDYALVEELRAQNTVVQCEESESHFKYGFSAGPIVQQEAHEHPLNKKRQKPIVRLNRNSSVQADLSLLGGFIHILMINFNVITRFINLRRFLCISEKKRQQIMKLYIPL